MRSSMLLFLGVALACGCMSTFGERQYFRQATADGRGVNYFQVNVNGFLLVSSSR